MQIEEHVREVKDTTLLDEVTNSKMPVVMDFWAEWCGPCRVTSPVMEELAAEFEGKAKFLKVNVDENPGTTAQYEVQSIPTIVFIKNGKETNRVIGAFPKDHYYRQIRQLLEV